MSAEEALTINTHKVNYGKLSAPTKGILAALMMSSSAVALTLLQPNDQFLRLVSVILIPLIVALFFLKNLMHALTLVWLNEAFLGVGGMWIKAGPIPGRYLLLFSLLFLYIIKKASINTIIKCHRDRWIVFYGTIFPFTLLLYSLMIGNSLSNALSDVTRFFIILTYFPLRNLITKNFKLLLGWLTCTTAVLSVLYVSLSVAPDPIRFILLDKWIFGFSGGNNALETLIISTGRATLKPMILCVIGFFIGIIYAIDSKVKMINRLASVLLLFVTSAAFVVSFARGPIIAVLLVLTLLTILVLFGLKKIKIKRVINLTIVTFALLSVGYLVTVIYIPIAGTKWNVRGLTLQQVVSPVRIEQTKQMLGAWLEKPLLGQGVGSAIPGYQRSASGLSFEVQYPMILYRTGLIGFSFILAPLIWIVWKTARKFRKIPELIKKDEGKLLLAIGCSISTLLIASCVNPYLASSMIFILITLFLAVEEILPKHPRKGVVYTDSV